MRSDIEGMTLSLDPTTRLEAEKLTYCNNSKIAVNGKCNYIKISKGVRLVDLKVEITSDANEIFIGDNCRITGSIICKIRGGSRLLIGDGTSIGGAALVLGEGKSIHIGSDCMLAYQIDIRTTDSHGIYDMDTGRRINPAASIVIGDHVWLGARVKLRKGAEVASGSVVAADSVVTKSFVQKNVLLAGIPARIVREGVEWRRPLLG
jgi:acetyltransferase-like isoleucine patch superfamily enzyme